MKALYQPWNEDEFSADLDVQAMTPFQRWLYRTLCQKSFVCSTRPYLPVDDSMLWKLSGAPSILFWEQHKDAVLAMFERIDHNGIPLLSRKRLVDDWHKIQGIRDANRDKAVKQWQSRGMPGHSSGVPEQSKEVREVREGSKEENLTPPTPPTGGDEPTRVAGWGGTVVVHHGRKRLWTDSERQSLVGSRAPDIAAFFRRKGFRAEVET